MTTTAEQELEVNDLPKHLSERVRAIRNLPIKTDGDFVLYWMHHAVRSHENPALDIALWAADRINKPVLVYQGLGGQHAYNSDRHHTFIMQGAREVQEQLQDRCIAYVFYLGRKPSQPTPLKTLARRAALVVTEDFPAPPFPQWTRHLTAQVNTALWAVDCACIIPMRLIHKAFTRAFAFRKHTLKEYEWRLEQPWPEIKSTGPFFAGDCGFDSIDFSTADISELCARCLIDHTISPVAHTPGGSTAGYNRWEQFKRHGLKSYARLRNDAAIIFPRGVSRISAYLHHGHVSPFRIARETAQIGSDGADKFLDELLVWRELAHNFCFHHQDVETLDALPSWARQTVLDHINDPREAVYSWERLYRGHTGDELWDAAQQSLLIHGELHNNVRMTWGKAILNWAAQPQYALDLMIDLNHRWALDGNDPNSYGGLLWCLGLFDRPFKPERPIIGTLRPRRTKDHAKRLDMVAYRAKVKGPANGEPLMVAVIGAGLSGLFAARTLVDHGHQVTVFEEENQPGGRTASQHFDAYAFDTGAQYFTVRDERLRRYVHSWYMEGIAQPWKGKLAVIKGSQILDENRPTERWVGVPSMDAIAAHLSSNLDIRYNTKIISVAKELKGWNLRSQRKEYGSYDVVIVAAPPPQITDYVKTSPKLYHRIAKIDMQPCLALMAAFEQPLEVSFDAAFVHNAAVRWVARNNSKPQRPEAECWVLHATSDWSHDHSDKPLETISPLLINSFFQSIGHKPIEPIYQTMRYWPSAAAANPLGNGCLWDAAIQLGVCGDWCQMSRAEGACLSGMAVAGRVLGQHAKNEYRLMVSKQ